MSRSSSIDPVKETCRLIRLARSYWDAHRNPACRTHRAMAMKLYESLSREQKEAIPQALRVWLRFRSEKYFGPGRTAPGTKGKKKKR
jgi:CRP-like cAMP-binding protein